MNQDTSGMVLGAIILAVTLPTLYFAMRFIARLGDQWRARRLVPLAAAIGGQTTAEPPRIAVLRAGRKLHLSYAPKTSVGTGESATSMNEFSVQVIGVEGGQEWRAIFHVTGMLGQGLKRLHLELKDQAQGGRLVDAGLLTEIEAVCHPTTVYAAATFNARRKTLTVVDDVSPKTLPDVASCERLISLALRVADLNEQVQAQPI